MTASMNELTAPSRGPLAAVRASMSRNEFLAGLYIIGCANGLLIKFILNWKSDGWAGVVFGTNAIVLFACFAGISSMLRDKRDEDTVSRPCSRRSLFLVDHSSDLRLELGGGNRS